MTQTAVAQKSAIVVPILGMHGSGTSVFTRALNLLGLELGQPLLPPQEHNPKEFWENEFFWSMNIRILRAMDKHFSGYGDYTALAEIPELSARVSLNPEDLDFIAQYIAQTFDCPRWGWKDPRSVLLFPFWLNVLTSLGCRDIRPALVVRHPSACIQSLLRRGDILPFANQLQRDPTELILDMWKAYNGILQVLLDDTDCFITAHHWLIDADQAREELARCAKYLGVGDDAGHREALSWMDSSADDVDAEMENGLADAESLALYWNLVFLAERQRAAAQPVD